MSKSIEKRDRFGSADFEIREKQGIWTGHFDHPSLDRFVERFGKKLGQPYLLRMKGLRVKDGIAHLPMYMVPPL